MDREGHRSSLGLYDDPKLIAVLKLFPIYNELTSLGGDVTSCPLFTLPLSHCAFTSQQEQMDFPQISYFLIWVDNIFLYSERTFLWL